VLSGSSLVNRSLFYPPSRDTKRGAVVGQDCHSGARSARTVAHAMMDAPGAPCGHSHIGRYGHCALRRPADSRVCTAVADLQVRSRGASCRCVCRPAHHSPSRSSRLHRRARDRRATQHRRSPRSREIAASSGGRNRAGERRIPIRPGPPPGRGAPIGILTTSRPRREICRFEFWPPNFRPSLIP
jgi:hypothetical protein